MKFRSFLVKSAYVGASLLIIGGCGKKKKGSSTTSAAVVPGEDAFVTLPTSSLQLSEAVVILQGQESAGTGLREVSFKLADEKRVRLRVTNEAFRSVEQAGSIMCFLAQTKFWEQANNGPYLAQVDNKLCENDSGGGGGGGQGGGSSDSNQAPELQAAYVEAKREENKPLIAEFRIAAGDMEGAYYHAKVIVLEPPSEAAPAGIFDMKYTARMGNMVGGSGFITTKRTADGQYVLETGSNQDMGDRKEKSQGIALLSFPDSDTVTGTVYSDSTGTHSEGSESSAGKARFDEKFLNVDFVTKRSWGGQEQEEKLLGCYDLNKFKTAIYRYDLLDAAGKVVTLNSGFPIEYTAEGKTHMGWAGYHGIWLGPDSNASSGMTVNKVDFGNNGSKTLTPYTVVSAPGKLMKMTKSTTTLGALKGSDLYFWSEGDNYIVQWNGTAFVKTGKQVCGDNGCEEEAASGAITIPQWGLNLWVPSLNTQLQFSDDEVSSLSDAYTIAYHSESMVSGTDQVPSCQLKCFSNCPVMAPTANAFSSWEQPSALYETISAPWGGTTNQANSVTTALQTYTWDSSTNNLKVGSTAFALPSGLSSSQEGGGGANVHSGALVCADDWNAISDKSVDPWRLQSQLTTYYQFRAGPRSWDQFISLKDANNTLVKFDAPLDLAYNHTTANDWDGSTDTAIVGKNYRLQYNGSGQLWGMPWKYNKDVGHHMPLFSIKTGAKIGDYTVQPLDGEQRLAKTEDANCSALTFDALPELPSIDSLTAINVGELGDENTVLRYVGGVAVD